MANPQPTTDTASTARDYQRVKKDLLAYEHVFSSLPTSPHPVHSIQLRNILTSLQLHPVLEAVLHLLNLDLPAAHFLCRHMESRPAEESMFVHGILHRIEGDYDNTRAWYGDVAESECFNAIWQGGRDEALEFIDEVETWRKSGQGKGDEEERLRTKSLEELTKMLGFCERKFGTGKVEDATSVWVSKGKTAEQAAAMITGGEGWREF